MPLNLKPLVKGFVGSTLVATPTGLYLDEIINHKDSARIAEVEEANQQLINKAQKAEEDLKVEKAVSETIKKTIKEETDLNIRWGITNPLTNPHGCKKYEEQKVKENNEDVTIPGYMECYSRQFLNQEGKPIKFTITLMPEDKDGQDEFKKWTPVDAPKD